MRKEDQSSVIHRMKYYKQQAENKRRADLVAYKQRQTQQEEARRLDELERERHIQEKINRTIETFEGSGIIESFQELIDNNILTNRTITKWMKGLFGRGHYQNEESPAFITYNVEEVTLNFGEQYLSHWDGLDWCGAYEHNQIIVKKVDNNLFELAVYDKYIMTKVQEGSSEATIDTIAKMTADPGFNSTGHWYNK